MPISAHIQSAAKSLYIKADEIGLPVQPLGPMYSQRILPTALKILSSYAIGFVRRSGVRVLELSPGHVVCRMPLKGNVNHIGTMYAGALFTLAEFPAGPMILATFGLSRYVPIVTALDLEFVSVAKSDITLTLTLPEERVQAIEQDAENHGEAKFVLHGELKDTQGKVVARSTATYLLRPKRK